MPHGRLGCDGQALPIEPITEVAWLVLHVTNRVAASVRSDLDQTAPDLIRFRNSHCIRWDDLLQVTTGIAALEDDDPSACGDRHLAQDHVAGCRQRALGSLVYLAVIDSRLNKAPHLLPSILFSRHCSPAAWIIGVTGWTMGSTPQRSDTNRHVASTPINVSGIQSHASVTPKVCFSGETSVHLVRLGIAISTQESAAHTEFCTVAGLPHRPALKGVLRIP